MFNVEEHLFERASRHDFDNDTSTRTGIYIDVDPLDSYFYLNITSFELLGSSVRCRKTRGRGMGEERGMLSRDALYSWGEKKLCWHILKAFYSNVIYQEGLVLKRNIPGTRWEQTTVRVYTTHDPKLFFLLL